MGKALLVCGLGRCGTTAVMSMLHAANVPVIGTAPDFERSEAFDALRAGGISSCIGKAIKWLDGQNAENRIEPGDFRAIFMMRNSIEQAKSALRFVGAPESRRNVRSVAYSIRKDEKTFNGIVNETAKSGVMSIHFEDLLLSPETMAKMVTTFIQPIWPDLKIDHIRMAQAIHTRTPDARKIPWEYTT